MIQLPNISFRMKLRHKIAVILSLCLVAGIAHISVRGSTFAVIQPKGWIAQQQYDLLVFATLLSLIVVIPVFGLTAFIVWQYREGNTKAKYTPDWGGNILLELIWWGIPLILIVILAVVTWRSSHALDPYKALSSNKQPVRVQVVALQWKWLFIYPDENIATINYLRIPEDRPINFEITADAPMNSFWIPQLGGQVYAMSGMTTKLHLIADTPGTYAGSSANISGEGFADMRFTTEATSQASYNAWVQRTKKSKDSLDQTSYLQLVKPTINASKKSYVVTNEDLFDSVIMKYMSPATPPNKTEHRH